MKNQSPKAGFQAKELDARFANPFAYFFIIRSSLAADGFFPFPQRY
ncbi:MAG TPA: hypothetical protein VJB59_02570 [Bdellovibrionota bacterium]|nr:hypothetical protein [Bdellovibrionota bacterium]